MTDKITGKASYVFNKDRAVPASVGAATSTETKLGTLFSTVAVDPQVKTDVGERFVVRGLWADSSFF